MRPRATLLLLLLARSLGAQTPAAQDGGASGEERWSVYLQSTAIGQAHPGFPAEYSGFNSLPDYAEKRVSLTATVFADFRLCSFADFVIDPELAGGRGFGYVSGIAGFTNGEIPRVAGAAPSPYIARAFVRIRVPLGREQERMESAPNQLGGSQPVSSLTIIAGKFSVTDFFDNNTYSHDPRSEFINWSLMSNGAWDYPADVRGYTEGIVEDLRLRSWSLRHATVLEPEQANGRTLDTRIGKNRGEVVELEHRHAPLHHPGAVRLLGYWNREDAGNFRESLQAAAATGEVPVFDTSRRNGAAKYGFGVNVEQEILRDLGVFGRYGWSDGKTEAWAFTQIDRSVSGGVSIGGWFWKRPRDHAGAAAVRNYLSGDQRAFLAAGGMGFLIGDGRLNYHPESIVEIYYAVPMPRGFTLTGDYQHVGDPAYNRARGPVAVYSLRVHWESTLRGH
jgi:high affinity Mn2+ porin